MESSQPLSIESFSYSWLVNLKSSYDGLDDSLRASFDASDEASFIEMDPRLTPSKRFFRRSHDFNFDFPLPESSSLALVHADELISNGFVTPIFVKPMKVDKKIDASESVNAKTTMSTSSSTKNVPPVGKFRCSSLRKCRRASRRILHKYLSFFTPLCHKILLQKPSSKAQSFESRTKGTKNCVYSPPTSPPRVSVAYSADYWRRSCDSESSIHEAVLHCKRTIGK